MTFYSYYNQINFGAISQFYQFKARLRQFFFFLVKFKLKDYFINIRLYVN